MEKYGVEEAGDLSGASPKTASERANGTCPGCGARLRAVKTTGVLLCPKCGSKPFEVTDGAR